MAKYNVTEVTFKEALASLGGSAWMASIKQGGYASVEFDDVSGMLTLEPAQSGTKRRRVHVSNTKELVYGVTTAANKAGGPAAER